MAFNKKINTTPFLDPDEILADSVSAFGSIGIEHKIERPLARFSNFFFRIIILCGVLYLALHAWRVQVASGDVFFAKSQENRFITRSIIPPRGIIYDRYHTPLVRNDPSFSVVFEKDTFLKNDNRDLASVLENLSSIFEKPKSFFYELGFPQDGADMRIPDRIVVAEGVDPDVFISFAPRVSVLPGIVTYESFRRMYMDQFAFSHAIGFVGKVTMDDLNDHPEFLSEERIGKSGLEVVYDDLLRGSSGKKIVETDARGRETRFRLVEEAHDGKNLMTALDGALQSRVYAALEGYIGRKKGASVVAVDPRDGSVLALVSYPGFDSNRFGYALSSKEFTAVLNDPLKPMFNRAVAGEFPSGSTIKPIIASAALEENIIDPEKKIYDEGFIEIPNPYYPGEKSVFVDWKKHGWIDFYDAIAQSANVYFYMIGGGFKDQQGLGIDRIKKYANRFGLGERLGIDVPGEKPGFIPDPAWKKEEMADDPVWRIGDTYNTSIGQGWVRTTPLQMAMATAAIANRGSLFRPHLLLQTSDSLKVSETAVVGAPVSNVSFLIRDRIVSNDTFEKVIRGMRQTVTSGTARLLGSVPAPVAAKTGTAQAGSGLPHAWVIAFAPVENPRIAIVVMVEHAGEGSTVAVPIMNDILTWYFQNRL